MSSALIPRDYTGPTLADEAELQTLWLSLARRTWRSLALLGASHDTPTLAAANSLAQIAWWYTGQPTCVFDMRDVSLRVLDEQVRDISAQLRGGERIFVALRSLSENPAAMPLAMAADGVVLCVKLGRSEIKRARQAITTIGRERFLGTILV